MTRQPGERDYVSRPQARTMRRHHPGAAGRVGDDHTCPTGHAGAPIQGFRQGKAESS